jgi:hypothetical protein
MTFKERGHFKGLLEGVSGKPIANNGLWALTLGSGNRAGVAETLYFTAGVENESHGLFGSIEALSQNPNGNDRQAPQVPKSIRAPEPSHLLFHGFAQGDQIYTWNGATWGSATPEATLFDEGAVVLKHFGGPTWEAADGSKVTGAVIQPTATVDPTAIPWLLLTATNAGGPGVIANTTYIHRVNTSGGRAPSTPGSVIGETVRIPYTADYFFYRDWPNSVNE